MDPSKSNPRQGHETEDEYMARLRQNSAEMAEIQGTDAEDASPSASSSAPDALADGQQARRNRKNVYMCHQCGHGYVTLDVDQGTTPFMAVCFQCGGLAHSMMYNIPDQVLGNHVVEWYKPNWDELAQLSEYQRAHVERGGLIHRVVGPNFNEDFKRWGKGRGRKKR